MEALLAVVLTIAIFGGIFLAVTAVGCIIGWLLCLIDAGRTDHL